MKRVMAVILAVCGLLSACGRNGIENTTVSAAETAKEYDKLSGNQDPAGACTVTQYGNTEVSIYREESDWSESYLYRAEFILDGVDYHLSIHSDDQEDIYAYLDIVLGEPKDNGNQIPTNVLGFDVRLIEMEEVSLYQHMWHYYIERNGVYVCVAEQFGYDGPESWSRDLDDDGAPELVCNNTFADGVSVVTVYRNNNGAIEAGRIRPSYYDEKFSWSHVGEAGTSGMPVERYDAEREIITATDYYTNGYDNPVTVEFDDGLAPFDFLPFTHLP